MQPRAWRPQNMPSPLNNGMGPITAPDWQVLLSAYAPLVVYGAVCAAGWALPRTNDWRAAVRG
jgi:hypothetical protein